MPPLIQVWNARYAKATALRVARIEPQKLFVRLKGHIEPIRPFASPYFEAAQAIIVALDSGQDVNSELVLEMQGCQRYLEYKRSLFPEIDLPSQAAQFIATVEYVRRRQRAECLIHVRSPFSPRVIDGHHRVVTANALGIPVDVYVPLFWRKEAGTS